MAPNRHGMNGAGHSEYPDDSPQPPIYGTRSSKRKLTDVNDGDAANSQTTGKVTSPMSSKKPKLEPKLSASKKRIDPPRQKASQLSQSSTPEDIESSISPSPEPGDPTMLDGPDESSDEETSRDPSPKKGWAEPDDIDALPLPPMSIPASPRGGFRGRGSGRGRGSRGGRWGRPRGNLSGRATPAPANGIVKFGRGGGRGRVKKHASSTLRAIERRKDELKQLFRSIAQQQKVALLVVAEKSLAMAAGDPQYEKNQPEYGIVMTSLDLRRDAVIREHRVKEQFELEATKRKYRANVYCARSNFEIKLDAIYDKYQAKILDHATYIYTQGWANEPLDAIPFSKGERGRLVKNIMMPEKILHPIGASAFKAPLPASSLSGPQAKDQIHQSEDRHVSIGDNELEQHPANYWLSLTLKGQQAFYEKAKQETLAAKKEANRNPRYVKEALFKKKALAESALPEEEEPAENEGDKGGEDVGARVGIYDSDDPHEYAQEQLEDEFGSSVPRRRGRGKALAPNNRIIAPSTIEYEDYEIGQRVHYFKNINGEIVDIGRDPHPKPRNLHLNQVVSNHNSAKNKPGDLDADLVEQYKVHPRLGVAIQGSVNPDFDEVEKPTFPPPSYCIKQVSNSSIMLVEEGHDGERRIHHVSRGALVSDAQKDSDALMAQIRMHNLLKAAGDFEAQVVYEIGVIDPELIEAANSAVLEDAKPVVPSPVPFVPSPVAPSPQRHHHYDPVRDVMGPRSYVTPYGRQAPPSQGRSGPTPISHPPGRIGELADVALRPPEPPEIRTKIPTHKEIFGFERHNNPFSSLTPIQGSIHGPMGPPPPFQQMIYATPQQQQYPAPQFYHSHQPAPQYSPSQPQQQSPRMNSGPLSGSGLRQLLPAQPRPSLTTSQPPFQVPLQVPPPPQGQQPPPVQPFSWSPYGGPGPHAPR